MNEMNKLLSLSLWLSFFSLSINFLSVLLLVINVINPHVHEKGPRGRKYFIFGDRFYSKNTRKLRFYTFL